MAAIKYTKELTDKIVAEYAENSDTSLLAEKYDLPERSVIAKLASLGVYKKKVYTDKQGNAPVKKEIYVEKIANILKIDLELAESLTKVNKFILKRLLEELSPE
jgi:hypothetical protein